MPSFKSNIVMPTSRAKLTCCFNELEGVGLSLLGLAEIPALHG
jgi:hypothetical protein